MSDSSFSCRGIITASGWHPDGAVAEIVIQTDSEDVLRVIPDGPGLALFDHLRQRVVVRGELIREAAKPAAVSVRSFGLEPVIAPVGAKEALPEPN